MSFLFISIYRLFLSHCAQFTYAYKYTVRPEQSHESRQACEKQVVWIVIKIGKADYHTPAAERNHRREDQASRAIDARRDEAAIRRGW
jgi:hypothetical protein